jgi:DnaJ homolog subfamily B member 12
MDGNKDEALRSVNLAKSAFASGDRQRAEKLIRIAQRLDPCLPLDDLLSATEKFGILNSATCHDKTGRGQAPEIPKAPKDYNGNYVDHGYTEENVRLVRDIRKKKDYYAILGVERRCSSEEIKKAYRRLSLKVHPDKNKAPGAEDAFKLVSKAFNCLSNDQSRKTYDQSGSIEDHEFSGHYSSAMRQGPARRRRQTRSSFYNYEEDFDPDEIFRSFFYGTHDNVFRAQNSYRARAAERQQRQQRREHTLQGSSGINLTMLSHLAVVLFSVALAFIPVRQPEYSLRRTAHFSISKVTEKHGVEYYVSKQEFDQQFPRGSTIRENIEQYVLKDYKNMLGRYCHVELQRRKWAKDYPTPHCDKLRSIFPVA